MKTTLEIPDPLFRQAKAAAALSGIPLRELVTQALTEKLRSKQVGEELKEDGERPWMRSFGALSHLHEETLKINKIIEDEFGRIEPEDRL